ncbi:MAG: P-loop NTPase [Endomicrobiaceae bacterium]|nr:P-loop NTPase [Endomicrobiaceae bacterium]MDD3923202.1 P-loop NTPase [Endomicrobiaceae bacterium]
MSQDCDCTESNCSSSCNSEEKKTSFLEKPNELSNIKKVIAVVSGKGGVGKSLVTSLLSVMMSRKGYKTAIMDADITGPSIPKAFGITEKPFNGEGGFFPVKSKTGISVMSINLLLDNETDPVIWRGPVISGVIKQFWTDVIWNDVDFMFIDMCPGTGDVPLTVFQSIPVDGIVIVTSPQELVSMIVEKAVNMAKTMNIPILGLVENMSYLKCPDCGKEIKLFGDSRLEETAKKYGIEIIDRLPIDPAIASACDKGNIESIEGTKLESNVNKIESLLKPTNENKKIKIAITYENGEVFQHFGHTEQFKVYTVENGKVISSEVIPTNGSGHSSLAGILKNLGINTLICGGIGGGAKNALNEQGIDLFPGASGNADEQINSFLAGSMKYNADVQCNHHEHGEGHTCSEHDNNCH